MSGLNTKYTQMWISNKKKSQVHNSHNLIQPSDKGNFLKSPCNIDIQKYRIPKDISTLVGPRTQERENYSKQNKKRWGLKSSPPGLEATTVDV